MKDQLRFAQNTRKMALFADARLSGAASRVKRSATERPQGRQTGCVSELRERRLRRGREVPPRYLEVHGLTAGVKLGRRTRHLVDRSTKSARSRPLPGPRDRMGSRILSAKRFGHQGGSGQPEIHMWET